MHDRGGRNAVVHGEPLAWTFSSWGTFHDAIAFSFAPHAHLWAIRSLRRTAVWRLGSG